jgi:hypothetical protein
MYNHIDWCEAGYNFGRLKDNWSNSPLRLFVNQQEKNNIDILFRLLHLKVKNKIFDIEDIEDFYQQLANISSEINKAIESISF